MRWQGESPRLKPGYQLVIECYFDDSGKEGDATHRFVTCAGYLTLDDHWYQFLRNWNHLLIKHGVPYVHMKEWVAIGEKNQWTVAKRREVLGEFAKAIKDADLIGFGVAVDTHAWKDLSAERRRRFGNVQEFCFGRLIRLIIDRVEGSNSPEKIGVVFDRDFEFAGRRLNIAKAIFRMDPRVPKRIISLSFADAKWHPQLQAADMLAWATRRELLARAKAAVSDNLWKLLLDDLPPYTTKDMTGEYWTKEHIDKYFPVVEAILASSSTAAPDEK